MLTKVNIYTKVFSGLVSCTCARIGGKPERGRRRRSNVLRLAEGDEDVRRLDVQVRKLLLVQVLQASGHLHSHVSQVSNIHN